MKKGKLVTVTGPRGYGVKMYEQDAIAQGLIPGKKAQPAKENKMMPQPQNKLAPAPVETKELIDDLTTIDGIGKATERALNARGIKTFEQLRAANVDFLSPMVKAKIEDWRNV
jgi:predicted flap endonuclease-1-like 5' DNA nuclease